MDERDDTRRIPGGRADEQVGLGRVVEDRLSTGSPDPDDPGAGDGGGVRPAGEPAVEESSEDSFPASDPPGFMSGPATSRDRSQTELPDPDDVP